MTCPTMKLNSEQQKVLGYKGGTQIPLQVTAMSVPVWQTGEGHWPS